MFNERLASEIFQKINHGKNDVKSFKLRFLGRLDDKYHEFMTYVRSSVFFSLSMLGKHFKDGRTDGRIYFRTLIFHIGFCS